MSKINVLYYSCPFDLSGYGTVSRNHLLGLGAMQDLNVRLRTKRFWQGVSPDLGDDGDRLHTMERVSIPEKDFIVIEHLTPENFYIDPRSKYHICYTPFETDGLPGAWILPMRGMDEIWVPSEHNKVTYIRAGLSKKKITVIPHGVDVNKYNPNQKPLQYTRGEYNFGSIFDWTERKNPGALIRAYYNSFFSGENVSLTIRTFWRFPIDKTREYVQGEVKKIKESYSGRKDFPKILFWFDPINESIMPNFYRSFDCFVLPTRGEGFGLPLLEAMACGVPVIGPEWGGNREFMNSENSTLVPGSVIPINNNEFLRYQPQYHGQKWFDIDEVELSKAMRRSYDHRDESMLKANVAVRDVVNRFTWDMAVRKIHSRILEIEGELV